VLPVVVLTSLCGWSVVLLTFQSARSGGGYFGLENGRMDAVSVAVGAPAPVATIFFPSAPAPIGAFPSPVCSPAQPA
jgi:hypothetical protein